MVAGRLDWLRLWGRVGRYLHHAFDVALLRDAWLDHGLPCVLAQAGMAQDECRMVVLPPHRRTGGGGGSGGGGSGGGGGGGGGVSDWRVDASLDASLHVPSSTWATNLSAVWRLNPLSRFARPGKLRATSAADAIDEVKNAGSHVTGASGKSMHCLLDKCHCHGWRSSN